MRGDDARMLRTLVIALLCSACSPSDPVPGAPATGAPATGEPEPRTFATQTDAPSPDYGPLIAKPFVLPKGEMRREATAPPPPDAKALGALWLERLEAKQALGGYGLGGKSDDAPIAMFDVLMTARDFDAWVAKNGWKVPPHLRFGFQPEMAAPRITPAAEAKVRTWPASRHRTGMQLEALLGGHVYVRDGCFLVTSAGGGGESLAFFHAETGLDVDEEGYLVFINRVTGETMGRLGEEMSWGGPPTAVIDPDQEADLRRTCGEAPIKVVGSPMSSARFNMQYPPPPLPPPPPPSSN